MGTNVLSVSVVYKRFVKDGEKLQKNLSKSLEKIGRLSYTKKEINDLKIQLTKSCICILRQKYIEFDIYCEIYKADALHFPNRQQNIKFLP